MSKPLRQVKKLFRELKIEIYKVVLLKSVLNTAIFFLAVGIVFALLTLPIKKAFVISGVFFLANFIFILRSVSLKVLEQKNKNLQDILSTAADNIEENSFMMQALVEDLIERIQQVSSGSLVDPRNTFAKTISIAILCFFIIFISSANININRIDIDLSDILSALPEGLKNSVLPVPEQQLNFSNDIYGDVNVAQLGNRKLDLTLATTLSDVDIDKRKDAYDRSFIEGAYVENISSVQDSISQERAPKEAKLALDYNSRIKTLD